MSDRRTVIATLVALAFAAPVILDSVRPDAFRCITRFARQRPIAFGAIAAVAAHLVVGLLL